MLRVRHCRSQAGDPWSCMLPSSHTTAPGSCSLVSCTKRVLRALYNQGSAPLTSAAMLGTFEATTRHALRRCPLGKDVSSNFVLNKKRGERGYLLMKMSPPLACPRGWASERLQMAPLGFPEQKEGNAECKLFQCLR